VDSRAASQQCLFVALVGSERNGHDFIPRALEKGVSVIFAESSDFEARRDWYKEIFQKYSEAYFIFSQNTLSALQNAAAAYVRKFPSLIKVGITGSSGKTTTKEIARSVLSQKYSVVCSEGNLNTETGLPLSVFKIKKEHQAGIFELGMNRVHEIEEIARVLKPQYAVITNIGAAHVGLLGSVDAIAREKKQIFSHFNDECAAFIPRDDSYADFLGEGIHGRIFFCSDTSDGLKALGIEDARDNGIDGAVFSYEGEEVSFGLAGKYNFKNLLAIITLARVMGLSHDEIARGIKEAKPYSGRSQIIRDEWTIIQDCYNANPTSMAAALDFFGALAAEGKKIAVLGDMLELGERAREHHKQIVELALNLNIDILVLVGKEMSSAFNCLKHDEKKRNAVFIFESWDEQNIARASEIILSKISKGDTRLVKGSRAIALERLVEKISGNKGAA
jgi:UDP-N-acetylmuramoyl-tripeptide--D-alanyl-D-alanine ligase